MENVLKEPIAVIDVGAHSIKMEIAQFDAQGSKEVLTHLEYSIFLGSDVFTKGKITSKSMRHACKIISDCAALMKEYGVSKYKAVATSAVREALNQDIFINRVKVTSDIDLKILEPTEEMKLIFLAVKDAIEKRFGLQKHNAVICNIGTGSTQIAFIEKGVFRNIQTLKFGTLRLIEEIFTGISSRRLKDSIAPFIENIVESAFKSATESMTDMFIVVGATARALVSIQRDKPPKHIATISRKDFENIFSKVTEMTPAQLVEKYHLSDSIAIGLEPCCRLIEQIFKMISAKSIVIPIINTRDVLLRDIVLEASGEPDRFDEAMITSAEFVAEKYNYDKGHSDAVSKYATTLFDMLKDIHNLDQKSRLLLQLAAILHDTGQFISLAQHHKHSYYLVINSFIPGLSQTDQKILALLCRYHRKSPPKTSHPEYTSLPTADRVRVCKIASILRISDALDRTHQSRVKIVKTETDTTTLNIHVVTNSDDITIETWGIKTKSDMFSDTFGLDVKLIGDLEI